MDVWELVASRATESGQTPSATLIYMLGLRGQRTEDEREARLSAIDNTPVAYEGLIRLRLAMEPIPGGLWRAVVHYGLATINISPLNPAAGGSGSQQSNDGNAVGGSDPIPRDVRGEIGAETVRVYHSILTAGLIGRDDDDRPVPDFRRAIAVRDRKAEGCDVQVGAFRWTEAWVWGNQYVTWDYLSRLKRFVGRVNNYRFRAQKAGEVKFLGATFDPYDTDKMRFVYQFEGRTNIAAFRLAEGWPAVAIEGHQFVWVLDEPAVDEDDTVLATKPRAMFVEDVGPDDDHEPPTNKRNFGYLGIGDAAPAGTEPEDDR